jgi:hypothetical protein
MTEPYSPRRRWPRLPVVVECRIEGVFTSLRLSELSFGGGYVDTTAILSVGDPVSLVMILDGEEATVSGRVVYTHAAMGFGFAFDHDQLREPSRTRITKFLKRNGISETDAAE